MNPDEKKLPVFGSQGRAMKTNIVALRAQRAPRGNFEVFWVDVEDMGWRRAKLCGFRPLKFRSSQNFALRQLTEAR